MVDLERLDKAQMVMVDWRDTSRCVVWFGSDLLYLWTDTFDLLDVKSMSKIPANFSEASKAALDWLDEIWLDESDAEFGPE